MVTETIVYKIFILIIIDVLSIDFFYIFYLRLKCCDDKCRVGRIQVRKECLKGGMHPESCKVRGMQDMINAF